MCGKGSSVARQRTLLVVRQMASQNEQLVNLILADIISLSANDEGKYKEIKQNNLSTIRHLF